MAKSDSEDGEVGLKRIEFGDDNDQRDLEEIMGWFNSFKMVIGQSGKKRSIHGGKRTQEKIVLMKVRMETDGDLESEGPSFSGRLFPITSNPKIEEQQQILKGTFSDNSTKPGNQKALEEQLQELQMQKKESWEKRLPKIEHEICIAFKEREEVRKDLSSGHPWTESEV